MIRVQTADGKVKEWRKDGDGVYAVQINEGRNASRVGISVENHASPTIRVGTQNNGGVKVGGEGNNSNSNWGEFALRLSFAVIILFIAYLILRQ